MIYPMGQYWDSARDQRERRLTRVTARTTLFCPTCKSLPGSRCVALTSGRETHCHSARFFLAYALLDYNVPSIHLQWIWVEVWRLFGQAVYA